MYEVLIRWNDSTDTQVTNLEHDEIGAWIQEALDAHKRNLADTVIMIGLV